MMRAADFPPGTRIKVARPMYASSLLGAEGVVINALDTYDGRTTVGVRMDGNPSQWGTIFDARELDVIA